MAGIDHTIIAFKNGKLMETTSFYHSGIEVEKLFEDTNEKYVAYEGETSKDLLPFKTDRDGLIKFDNNYLEDCMEVFPNMEFNHYNYLLHNNNIDFSKIEAEEGKKRVKALKKFQKQLIKEKKKYFKYLKSKNYNLQCPDNYVNRFYYKDTNDAEIIAMYDDTRLFCTTFYYEKASKDAYVIFGGYGHYTNPYLHFYHRGYGIQVERKMCKECYKWLMEHVLKECLAGIGLDPDGWFTEGQYKIWLERFNHIHWLDDRHRVMKEKSLIDLDPDSTKKKEEEWREQFTQNIK